MFVSFSSPGQDLYRTQQKGKTRPSSPGEDRTLLIHHQCTGQQSWEPAGTSSPTQTLPSTWRARGGRRPLDAIPRAHKLQQGTELHLPYFLSAWKLRCFPSCKGSSVPKNFSKAMTSFQDRTVYGGREPGLIIGTGKGERGIWKSSTFPGTGEWGSTATAKPLTGAAQRAAKARQGEQKSQGSTPPGTSLSSCPGKVRKDGKMMER